MTKLQLEGLKYAAGEPYLEPSRYIGNKLAAAGLIIYTGVAGSMSNQAWTITEKGEGFLAVARMIFLWSTFGTKD